MNLIGMPPCLPPMQLLWKRDGLFASRESEVRANGTVTNARGGVSTSAWLFQLKPETHARVEMLFRGGHILPDSKSNQFYVAAQPECSHDSVLMKGYGACAYTQNIGRRSHCPALSKQLQYLALPASERPAAMGRRTRVLSVLEALNKG